MEQPQYQSQPQQPFFEMGGSSSTPQIPFDSMFLQSFSNLQVQVASLYEHYNEVAQDIHQMTRYKDSINEGVTYLRGFVEPRGKEDEVNPTREERAMR